jgi:hypothetical protein
LPLAPSASPELLKLDEHAKHTVSPVKPRKKPLFAEKRRA